MGVSHPVIGLSSTRVALFDAPDCWSHCDHMSSAKGLKPL